MTTSVLCRTLKGLPLAALVLLGACASDDSKSKKTETPARTEPRREAPAARVDGDMSRTVMAFPTGDRSTSVILLEVSAPAEVRVNQPYAYEMKVTNLTNLTIENVTVIDTTAGAFAMKSSTPPAVRNEGGAAEWNVGRMGPGETKSISVQGNATGVGNITRCASVTYNSQACVVTRVVQPDLKIEKTAPGEVLACDPIQLTFRVTNSGTGAARNVVVTDQLPQGWTTADGQRTVTLNAGTLEGGASRDFTAMVKAAAPGSFENSATVKADGGLETKSNVTRTTVRQPVLTIQKKAPERRFIGREIEYEITVANTGDGVAKNTMLEDVLPAGTRFVSASDGGTFSGGKVTWSLGELAPKATKTVRCTASPGGAGQLRNEASARAYCAAAVSANAVTAVEGIPALLLEVIDLDDPIEIGKDVTYEIVVTNQGSAVGSNITIRVGLDEAMKFVSAGGATNAQAAPTAAEGGNFTYVALPALPAKQKAVWRVTVRATKAKDARLAVSMNADQIDRPYEETEGTRFY
ncbi:MAG TPA: DUF11 domain-containing protein [Planctomycetota bacterium]|nr:DUF11 domain-containing protein [Planctomycetota bacterium]